MNTGEHWPCWYTNISMPAWEISTTHSISTALKELTEIGGVEVVVRLRKNANVKIERRKEVSLRFIRKSRIRCIYGDIERCLFVEPGRDRVLIFSTLSDLGKVII